MEDYLEEDPYSKLYVSEGDLFIWKDEKPERPAFGGVSSSFNTYFSLIPDPWNPTLSQHTRY
jgi:hypothetical protein